MLPALVAVEDPSAQAAFVAQRMLELRDEGVPLEEMAVLYRAHFHSLELQMELTGRGSWVARLDSGAVVELGRGTDDEVLARTTRFLKTLTQVTARYGRRPDAVETADLRHPDGYALRLRGVSTVVKSEQKK